MFKLKIADLIIDVLANNDSCRSLFKDYLIDSNELADISISVDDNKDSFLDIHDN